MAPKRGPGEAQERPSSPTGTRPDGKGHEETRADKTSGRTRQQADKRSSGATKPRTPWPVSNLLLVHLMHGSTLVNIYTMNRYGGWGPSEVRRPGAQAQHTTQEDTRAEKPRQEDTSGDKTTEDKTRGKTRQQTDNRSSGATKPRTPWHVSNLLLVHLMHGPL